VPKKLHGELLTKVRDATTLHQVITGFQDIADVLEKHSRRMALRDLRAVMASFDIKKLRPEFAKEMLRALDLKSFQRVPKSVSGRLFAIIQYAQKTPTSQLPTDMVALQRAHGRAGPPSQTQ